jgi:hypothetical protein
LQTHLDVRWQVCLSPIWVYHLVRQKPSLIEFTPLQKLREDCQVSANFYFTMEDSF